MPRRLKITKTADGFEAVVLAAGDRRARLLGGLLVAVLALGLIADAYLLFLAMSQSVTIAIVVPFVILFFASLYWTPVTYTWLWNLSGREVIVAYDGKLRVDRVVWRNMRYRFEFDLLDVSNIRVRPEDDDPRHLTLRHTQARLGLGGNVAFDVEGRPYRVGIGLAELDAAELAVAMANALDEDPSLVFE